MHVRIFSGQIKPLEVFEEEITDDSLVKVMSAMASAHKQGKVASKMAEPEQSPESSTSGIKPDTNASFVHTEHLHIGNTSVDIGVYVPPVPYMTVRHCEPAELQRITDVFKGTWPRCEERLMTSITGDIDSDVNMEALCPCIEQLTEMDLAPDCTPEPSTALTFKQVC